MCRILILNLILIVSVLQIPAIPQLKRLGSKCVVEGKPGTCTFIRDCPEEEYRIVTLGKEARKSCKRFIGNRQLICCEETIVPIATSSRMSGQTIDCYYNGTFPFKCCPTEECHNTISLSTGNVIPTTGNIIIDKCIEYSQIIEQCMNRSKKYCKMEESDGLTRRIVNGKDAIPAEFPHMALLGYGQNKWDNGGTLISERAVLTAAHVLDLGGQYGKVQFVCLGILNRTKACKGSSYKYKVKTITVHPGYKHQKYYNDIALLLLEQTVLLSHRVRPACLPVMRSNITTILTVAGWGVIEANGQQPEVLLKTELKEHPASNCKDTYEGYRNLNELWNEDIMFCTSGPLNPKTNTTSDACQGDSGGPVTRQLQEVTCSYELVGIVSFGYGCGQGGPAGFTRVSNYTEWIVDNLWK